MRPPLSRVRTAVLVLTTLGLLLLAGLPSGPSPLHPASSGYVAAGTTASYGVPLTGHGSAYGCAGSTLPARDPYSPVDQPHPHDER